MSSVSTTSLVTRLKTEAKLGHTFYTDANGLYLMKRTHNASLPIEANYYPVGSAVVMQNHDTRVTLLSGQPMGAASETAGIFEAMVDRTVSNDDGKGLPYAEAKRSPPTQLKYTLLVEPRDAPAREERSIAYHSLITHQALEQLLHPPTVFLATAATPDLSPSLSLAPALPCDIELLNVRPLSDGSLLLLLRRLTFDCAAMGKGAQCTNSQDSMQALIDALNVKSIEETTLTGTTTLRQVMAGADILAQLGPMDLRAYRLRR